MEVMRGLRLSYGTVFGGLIALAVFGCGLVSHLQSDRVFVALFLLPVIFGTATLLLMHRHFYPRFFFFILGFATLILIRGTTVATRFLINLFPGGYPKDIIARKAGSFMAGGIIVMSFLSLSNNYAYPKQNFSGALQYINTHRKDHDIVVTVGLATYPYQRYYKTHWKSVETLEELRHIQGHNRSIWLVYTFKDHMEAFYPDIMSNIRKEFRVVQEFPGTVGGGTVYVCLSKPVLAGLQVITNQKITEGR